MVFFVGVILFAAGIAAIVFAENIRDFNVNMVEDSYPDNAFSRFLAQMYAADENVTTWRIGGVLMMGMAVAVIFIGLGWLKPGH